MLAALLPPTAYLPPVKKLVSGQVDTSTLLSALDYLYTLYRPEVRGSRRRRPEVKAVHGDDAEALDALETIRADDFERTYTIRWITSLVGLAEAWEAEEEEGEVAAEDIVQVEGGGEVGGQSESDDSGYDSYPATSTASTTGPRAVPAGDCEAGSIPTTAPSPTSVLVERAASLLAICAGTASAGTLTRAFTFASPGGDVSVQLTDVPLINADYTSVGAQTWGGACVLSDLIAERPDVFGLGFGGGDCEGKKRLRVLELGAGTGLVSLTVGKLLQAQAQQDCTAEVIATDFHPSVLANLGANIATNFPSSSSPSPSNVSVRSCFLDWAAFSNTGHVDATSDNADDNNSALGHEPFDIAFGADIIYEAEHARWIKGCLERLLRRPDRTRSEAPTFHLVIPLRSTHAFESSTIESQFHWAGALRDATNDTVEDELVIFSKETIVCDAIGGGGRSGRDDAEEVVYVYYRIGWGC